MVKHPKIVTAHDLILRLYNRRVFMTVEIDDGQRLLQRRHYTNSHIHQTSELARKRSLGECALCENSSWGIHKVLRDLLAGGGGTVGLDRARGGYTSLMMHLSAICIIVSRNRESGLH